MGTIEIDISEYEAMKENKRLLEDSLKNERGLQEQIKKLSEEKTKALEDAKMKVVKIKKSEVTEHVLRKRNDDLIYRELFHLVGSSMGGYMDRRGLKSEIEYLSTEQLIDLFFERAKSYSTPYEETTTHGLDEIKAEIRDVLMSEMTEDTKHKIKAAEAALLRNDDLFKENRLLTKENNLLVEKNKRLVERCDEVLNKLDKAENDVKTLSKVKDILKDGYGLWNRSKLLDETILTIK